jgi:hypothetical protein
VNFFIDLNKAVKACEPSKKGMDECIKKGSIGLPKKQKNNPKL